MRNFSQRVRYKVRHKVKQNISDQLKFIQKPFPNFQANFKRKLIKSHKNIDKQNVTLFPSTQL